MAPTLRVRFSHLVGWIADRRLPTPLRAPVYRAYCRLTGASPDEAELSLRGYPSLGAFFVRRLAAGARPIDPDLEALVSPCDGAVQDVREIQAGTILQAKGRPYPVGELVDDQAAASLLDGGHAWTLYLSPSDYHRIHAPERATLVGLTWLPGDHRSVAPAVLSRRDRVLCTNERVVFRLETSHGPCFLVMVGAQNVARIRVVGVPPGAPAPTDPPRELERGEELARFEMGSTVVLLTPPGMARPLPELEPGRPVRLGEAIGRFGGAGSGEAG